MSRTTGWPPGLLQDDSRELSTWLASRPGARRLVDERCAEIRAEVAARIIRSDERPRAVGSDNLLAMEERAAHRAALAVAGCSASGGRSEGEIA